jgi:hypothetical protein
MNVQNYLLLLSIGISLFIAGLSLRHSTSSRHIHLAAIAFAVAVWGLSYLVFYLQIVRVSTLLFISIVYLSSTVAGSGLLTFSLLYRNRFMGKKWLTLVLLAIEPVATQLLFWNASSREVLFTETGNGSAGLSFNTGIWGQINTLYLYGFEIVSVVLFAASFSRRPGKSFLRAGALLMSVFMLLVFRTRCLSVTPWPSSG